MFYASKTHYKSFALPKAYTLSKVCPSHHITNSHKLIFLFGEHSENVVTFMISMTFHTLLSPLSLPSHLFINFSSQRSFFLIFSSPITSWKDCAMTDGNVLRTLPIPSSLNHSLISLLDTSLFPSHN